MAFEIIEAEFDLRDTLNGYEIFKTRRYVPFVNVDSRIELKIALLNRNGVLIKKEMFSGPLTAKVSEIKQIFKEDADLYLKIDNRASLQSDNDMPLLKVYEIRDNIATNSYCYTLIAIEKPIMLESTSYLINLNYLRKIEVKNLTISHISIVHLKYLKYLKLINTNLKSIKPSSKILEFCNLANNALEECQIKAKVLILEFNQISSFESTLRFNFLNISSNPLIALKCSTKFLIIKNTILKTLLNCDATIIIADGTKRIRIGNCPNLKFVSINNCDLSKISFSVKNIIVLKAANNNFKNAPRFPKCHFINLSGNFLNYFKSCNAIALDLSMNRLLYFDFKKFLWLRHVNLSFNLIDRRIEPSECTQLESIIVSNSLKKLLVCNQVKTDYSHKCHKSNMVLQHYKLEILINSVPITTYLLIKTCIDVDLSASIQSTFDSFLNVISILNLFSDFSDHLYNEWSILDPKLLVLFILITDKDVMIRTFGFNAVYYNFAELKTISNSKTIIVFNNASAWCVLPLICPSKDILECRNYILQKESIDLNEIFQYLKSYCPKSLLFNVTCSPEFYEIGNKPIRFSVCKLLKTCRKNEIINMKKLFTATNIRLNECTNLGLSNFDFGLNIRRSDDIESEMERSIFLFAKFSFGSKDYLTVEMEKFNIFRILDFYCNIFGGKIAEKSYGVFIIHFRIHFHAAFFAIKIEKILKSVNIETFVGISTGLIFGEMENGITFFGGPGFNKTSRITGMGMGIYCSSCIKLYHPLIEIHDEGERYLKGFDENHRIFSMKLAKKY